MQCNLLNNEKDDVVLSQLPAGLEHLCLYSVWRKLPTRVLAQLQQVTYLELCGTNLRNPDTQEGSEHGEEWGNTEQEGQEVDGEEGEEAEGEEQLAVTGEENGELDFNLHPLQALPHLADVRRDLQPGLQLPTCLPTTSLRAWSAIASTLSQAH